MTKYSNLYTIVVTCCFLEMNYIVQSEQITAFHVLGKNNVDSLIKSWIKEQLPNEERYKLMKFDDEYYVYEYSRYEYYTFHVYSTNIYNKDSNDKAQFREILQLN